MRPRPASLFAACVLVSLGWLGVEPLLAPALPRGAQEAATQTTPAAPTVIKAEANLVLVDVITTDKKGNYIQDLEVKDFHVFEDDDEQPITSFSRAADVKTAGPEQRRYLVLFFDNSTMAPSDQLRARQAASQFVAQTAPTARLIAV